jgi:hypothetical protein
MVLGYPVLAENTKQGYIFIVAARKSQIEINAISIKTIRRVK